jgi:hypothetical protein
MPWLVWPKKDAYSAKVVGELSKSFDPAVSEWGNPVRVDTDYPDFCQGGKLGN